MDKHRSHSPCVDAQVRIDDDRSCYIDVCIDVLCHVEEEILILFVKEAMETRIMRLYILQRWQTTVRDNVD